MRDTASRRAKFIEDLAEARAHDGNTMAEKELKQLLLCHKEQHKQAWQIKRANGTLHKGGGQACSFWY